MKLPQVVAGLVVLGCLIPALAVNLAVVMWKDRTSGVTLAAIAFLVVSVPVALVVARRFYRPAGAHGTVEM